MPIVSGTVEFNVPRINSRSSTLSIDSLKGHHRSLYSFVARNKAGFNEYRPELRVNV